MFGSQKVWKTIQKKKKNRGKKWKKIKNKFKVNKFFYILVWTHFTYLTLFCKKINNFKINKFIINFNYI